MKKLIRMSHVHTYTNELSHIHMPRAYNHTQHITKHHINTLVETYKSISVYTKYRIFKHVNIHLLFIVIHAGV